MTPSIVPPIQPGILRIVPLGGFEEVGKSMTVFEYEDDIVVFDTGLQWPNESQHGIDYIIPDTSYLVGKEHKIRAVVISHGHYDHIGGLPHIMPLLGTQIPIYGLPMTTALILKRQAEFGATLNVQTIREEDVLQCGAIRVEFVRVNHNIPDAMGVAVTTPRGTVFHTGDYKIDTSPVNEKPMDLARVSRIGERNVLAFLTDATSASREGYQISEGQIMKNLEALFLQAEGRIITGTFSSLLSRLHQIIEISAKVGRHVVIEGRSMRENIAIASNLKYIQAPPGVLIDAKEMHRYEPNQITVVTTGAQGERYAALGRMAREEHATIKIEPGDTIIFSSSFIPGNERSIEKLIDLLYLRKANVIHYRYMDIHAGGHAMAEETKLMLQLLKPKVLIPQHGTHAQGIGTIEMAESLGYLRGKNAFVLHDGEGIEFFPDGSWKVMADRATNRMIAVDGLGVGDVGTAVIEERATMSQDGIFLILVRHDLKGKLLSPPDLVSRGFVFVRGAEKLLAETKSFIQELWPKHQDLVHTDPEALKQLLRTEVSAMLTRRTGRSPMIIPLLVKV